MRVPSQARPAFGATAVRSRAPVRGAMPSSVSPRESKRWSQGMTHLEESGHEVAGDGRLAPIDELIQAVGTARESRDPFERDRKVRNPMFQLVFELVQGLLHWPVGKQEYVFHYV